MIGRLYALFLGSPSLRPDSAEEVEPHPGASGSSPLIDNRSLADVCMTCL